MLLNRLIVCLLSLVVTYPYIVTNSIYAQNQLIEISNQSQEDTIEIIVTAKRRKQPKNIVAENIIVVSEEELEAMPSTTISEALDIVSGVVVQQNGSHGSQSLVTIQGSDFRHVQVLLDGITLNNSTERLADIGMIPLTFVKRIEILKGAASSVWGSALGGVINIITKDVGDTITPKCHIDNSFGNNKTPRSNITIKGAVGDGGYLFDIGAEASDGFRKNADYDYTRIYTKLSYPITQASFLSTSFISFKGNYGIGNFEDFGYFLQNDYDVKMGVLSLNSELNRNINLKIDGWVLNRNENYGYFMLEDEKRFDTKTLNERHYGIKTQGDLSLNPSLTLSLGLETENNDIELSDIDYIKDEIHNAIYCNITQNFDDLTLGVGVRFDDYNTYGNEFSPSFGITWRIPQINSRLKATVAKGFNAPPLSYKYYEDAVTLPNPDLKAERGWSYQIGIESDIIPTISTELNLFYHHIKDGIATIYTDDGYRMKDNFAHIARVGVETNLKVFLTDELYLKGMLSLYETKNIDNDKIIEGEPRANSGIALHYQAERLEFYLAGNYIYWNAPDIYEPKDKRFIWNTKLSYPIIVTPTLSLKTYLEIRNIFDTEYRWNKYYPLPDATYFAGITIDF